MLIRIGWQWLPKSLSVRYRVRALRLELHVRGKVLLQEYFVLEDVMEKQQCIVLDFTCVTKSPNVFYWASESPCTCSWSRKESDVFGTDIKQRYQDRTHLLPLRGFKCFSLWLWEIDSKYLSSRARFMPWFGTKTHLDLHELFLSLSFYECGMNELPMIRHPRRVNKME